ncbi:transmembrane 4 L6 family member 5-like isoform X2 [Marmota monax]|uniref:transmembrane 4 L6 family member 5-like isoform X2 n=1 Tax=Marmota monax TaxID=9995 RepID=UPI001EAFBDFE|nr:transmembrane 4 L6 family member 5-like isoform X2 [Marmota monax]
MHPRKCAHWVGLSLISLSLVCIVANALLLVPDGKTWSSDQLSLQVLLMPGFIGGGLMEWCLPVCFIEGLLGAIYCLTMSAEGLRIGPKCSINGKWDYHFQRDEYLSHPDDWNICEEPSNVVSWNVTFFSLLVVVSSLEILLIFSGCCFTCIAVSDEPRSNPF